MTRISFLPELAAAVDVICKQTVPEARRAVLLPLIEHIQSKRDLGHEVYLNFICTHNSRRSQFSQIWAQTAAQYFGIPARCFSGGVEITSFNERAVACLKRSGFNITSSEGENPRYAIFFAEDIKPIIAFSKLFNDPVNEAEQFATVMTCSHADENCPFIPGAEKRIAVRYEDPKAFDDTPEEAHRYDERSLQVASEMFYVFSKIQ
ncbi:MAG: protein-tyrosine-phosphatase [Flavobacteriales bacterium]